MHGLKIDGINHNAFVMWEPAATVHFYRDVMGFPLAHAITAKGWGQDEHADFAHIFFDIGGNNYAAFFYYFGVEARDQRAKDYVGNGRHMAFHCHGEDELNKWRAHLKASGVNVSPPVRHELIESIYFTDPNGYPLEITRALRPMEAKDATDAELTVAALLASVASGAPSAEDMWRRKGEMVAASFDQAA